MNKKNESVKIEISARTIVFTVFFLLLLKLLWIARDLIFSLFIAFIIMSALKPGVFFLTKIKIPRRLAVLIVFLGFIGVVIFLLSFALPPIFIESGQLISFLPSSLEVIIPSLTDFFNFNSLTQYVPNITANLFALIKNVFSNAIFLLSTLFFSFYLLLDENALRNLLVKFFEEKDVYNALEVLARIERRMSAWFWGELALMTIVGAMTFVGLFILGIKYPLSLAVIAGLLEVVPNLGPVIATIPAFLIAITQSYLAGISVIALYFIVQQLENNVIVPLIMKKAVGLNPIITLIALIVGGKIGGILGVILAIPATLFLETILIEILKTSSFSKESKQA